MKTGCLGTEPTTRSSHMRTWGLWTDPIPMTSPFLLPYRSLVNRVLICFSPHPFIYRNLMFVIILSWKCHLNLSLMSWGVAQNSTMWTSHCRPSWGWPQVLLHHQSVSQWHWTFCLFDCFYLKNLYKKDLLTCITDNWLPELPEIHFVFAFNLTDKLTIYGIFNRPIMAHTQFLVHRWRAQNN